MKIIINGLGRIGKLVFRRLCDKGLYKNILLVNEIEAQQISMIIQIVLIALQKNYHKKYQKLL